MAALRLRLEKVGIPILILNSPLEKGAATAGNQAAAATRQEI
jgi:hypothetical protein